MVRPRWRRRRAGGAAARRYVALPLAVALLSLRPAAAEAASAEGDTVTTATCRIVESAARASRVPAGLLTRLVWTESRFRAGARSPAGAQGIAQFMPDTAAAQGLIDPFDPEQAIPKAASLLAELAGQFGNFGLAAAGYNAGAARVTSWLGGGGLPFETRNYVLAVTGRTAEDWAADRRKEAGAATADPPFASQSCLQVTAELQAEDRADQAPIAPWGVQLAGNFSKAVALASYQRARQRYPGILGGLQPMVIGSVLRSRGTRRFYRVLAPAATRAAADQVCRAILADGGACVALRS